jgi:hypothetical protein
MIPAEVGERAAPREYRLSSRTPLDVHVVDGAEQSVEGAVVQQLGLAPKDLQEDAAIVRAHRLFRRVWTTDVSGRLLVAPTRGKQSLLASQDELESAPWFGTDPQSTNVQLQLAPCFTLRGSVRVTSGAADATPVYLDVATLKEDGQYWRLHQSRVIGAAFGPIRLPVIATPKYVFDLSGGGLVFQTVERATPTAGEVVEISFETARGFALPARVLSDTGGPIAGARVFVLFYYNEAWRGSEAMTGADGIGTATGIAAGQIYVEATAKAYITKRIGPLLLDREPELPVEVSLEPAGRVAGRVTASGHPVATFTIEYWRGNPLGRLSQFFYDRVDGEFELDDVPTGAVILVASAAGHAQSAPVELKVTTDETIRTEIALPAGVPGRGRVVDVVTSEPIANAHVELFTNVGDQALSVIGLPVSVNPDGTFELGPCAPGVVRYFASAPGYARRSCSALAKAGGDVDLGVIALARRQPLAVRLVAAEVRDFSGYVLDLFGQEAVTPVRFDSSGWARMESVAPGRWEVRIVEPGGGQTRFWTSLRSGSEWTIDVPIGWERSLRVVIVPAGDRGLHEAGTVWVEYLLPGVEKREVRLARSFEPADPRVEFPSIAADRVTVHGLCPSRALFYREITLQPGENVLRVTLDDAATAVRVVDNELQPVSGVLVTVLAPARGLGARIGATTDSDGIAMFPKLEPGVWTIGLEHPGLGAVIGSDVQVAGRTGELIEVQFEPTHAVRVRLADGTDAVAGAEIMVFDPRHVYGLFAKTTNSEGEAVQGPVGAGHYLVDIDHPGCWGTTAKVDARADDGWTEVQVRRLGSLELEVRNAGNVAIAGASVGLESIEFGTDVGSWISEGRVSASHGLATDERGVLRVDGLPRGFYRWSIAIPNAAPLAGTVEVPPNAVGRAMIAVP